MWIIYERLTQEQASLRSTSANLQKTLGAITVELRKRVSECERAAPTSLAGEVAGLADAVDKLRQTQRRFQGRFDQYVGQELPSARGADPSYAGVNQLDPELAAELALQNAPSAAPGSK